MMIEKRKQIPEEIRSIVKEIFDNKCFICGQTINPMHIHHLNGNHEDNDLQNLCLCCYLCHAVVFHPYKAEEIIQWHENKYRNNNFI